MLEFAVAMRITLQNETDWDGWRQATRTLVQSGMEPETLSWVVGGEATPLPDASGTFHVPRTLVVARIGGDPGASG